MADSYDLIVIGAGMAGVNAADKCRAAGWRVAIVDELPLRQHGYDDEAIAEILGTVALERGHPLQRRCPYHLALHQARRRGRGGRLMPATNPPTIDALVDALAAAGGTLDDDQRRTALTTYRLLARGSPVTDATIAGATGLSEDVIEGYFAEWEGVFRNGDDDAIVGFWGLALEPLTPRYELVDHDTGEAVGYAWCAWDTLFLPTVLGRTLDVTATDGHTGEPVTLIVGADGAQHVSPRGAVVSFVAPDTPWESDVLTTFCHKVLFFTGQANADAWIAQHPDTLFSLDVDDAFDLGRRWLADRYGDSLNVRAPLSPAHQPAPAERVGDGEAAQREAESRTWPDP